MIVGKYTEIFNPVRMSVNEPIITRENDMVPNRGGGYGFYIDPVRQLRRFLILGSDSPTYYASAQEMTKENCGNIIKIIQSGDVKFLDEIVTVSYEGLAPKNDAALFALALVYVFGNESLKWAATGKFNKIVRTASHLFQFRKYLKDMGKGNGRSVRGAISGWYNQFKDRPEALAMQVVKYQNRNKWSHRNVALLAHVKPATMDISGILGWAVGKSSLIANEEARGIIEAYEEIKRSTDSKFIAEKLKEFRLPWEIVPTDQRDKTMWRALIPHMGSTALIRNIRNMSKTGAISVGGDGVAHMEALCGKLQDEKQLRSDRIHPLHLLVALKELQKDTDFIIPPVLKSLENAFYKAFKYQESSGKRFMIGVDVSGSMKRGEVAGCPQIEPWEGAGLLALQLVKSEPKTLVYGFAHSTLNLNVTDNDNMDSLRNKLLRSDFGSTNPGALIRFALEKSIPVDVFIVITDNEANSGHHPSQVLKEYRNKMNNNAKMVVISMTPVNYSIADPKDQGQMDVVGFDSSVPAIIQNFAKDSF